MTPVAIAALGIGQLHARFVDAVWRKDPESLGDCFAEDAEWKIAGRHMRGRVEIKAAFSKLLSINERVVLTLSTPILEVRDTDVTGRIYCVERTKMTDGSAIMTIGVYYDRYIGAGDTWHFLRRHWTLHYRGPADMSAAFIAGPDYGPPPGMPGENEPTFVRKADG